MNYLDLKKKNIFIFGVSNKRSIAYHISKLLVSQGANLSYVVRRDVTKTKNKELFQDQPVYICDFESQTQIDQLFKNVQQKNIKIDGIVHAIAYADYSKGQQPFHETQREGFMQAMNVSCYSLIAIAQGLKSQLNQDASVVTFGISAPQIVFENYNYMAPIKAALDTSVRYLAKSFSHFSNVRFNSVGAGLLKTRSAAGIPGFADAYLFSEMLTPRTKALQTEEVAHVAAFLLSARSSGINAQSIVVDAGLSVNYLDEDMIKRVLNPD